MTNHPDFTAAFAEGEQACADGTAASDNPYWEAGPLRAGWQAGFNAMRDTREEWEAENDDRARAA